MNRLVRQCVIAFVASAFACGAAQAQLFRAYLSINGSDANPCTVAAPCRLLPAALNAVADGGEIWILDSANFNTGTVHVTKSVSIIGAPGQLASVLALGGAVGMSIEGAAKAALRNINVSGSATNPGTEGIIVDPTASLSVEDCVFSNLLYEAIYADFFGPASTTVLHVKNSVFRNVGGERNSTYWVGVRIGNGATANITNSQFLKGSGAMVFGSAGTTTTLNLTDSFVSGGFLGIQVYTQDATAVARAYVTRSTLQSFDYALQTLTSGVGTATITVS